MSPSGRRRNRRPPLFRCDSPETCARSGRAAAGRAPCISRRLPERQRQQFAVNPRRAPQRVGPWHRGSLQSQPIICPH
jgi:hypothetical protein